jgi:hypothetical protein
MMSGFLRHAARVVAVLVAVLLLPAGFAAVSATSKVLELPVGDLPLDGPAWPWGPPFLLLVLALPGALLAVFARFLLHQIITKILDRSRGSRHTHSPWWTLPRPIPNPNSNEPSAQASYSSSWSATSSERGSTP